MSRPNTNLIVQVEGSDGQTETYHPGSKDPRKIPREIEITDKLGVGFESSKVTLARSYRDQDPNDLLKTIRCVGAGGFVANECRVHGAPKSSENGTTINGVGWMNHGKDRAWGMNFIDSDVSAWQGMPLNRRIAHHTAGTASPSDGASESSAVVTRLAATPWTSGALPITEAWYAPPAGLKIGSLEVDAAVLSTNALASDSNYLWQAVLASDDAGAVFDAGGDLQPSGATASDTVTPSTSDGSFAFLQMVYGVAVGTGDSEDRAIAWTPRVYGTHGLTSVTASEALKYGLANGAPLFNWTDASITDTDLELAQLMVGTEEKFAGLLEKVNALYLYYAHVWEDRQFSWGPLSDDTIPDYEMSVARGDTFDGTGDQVDEDGPFNECYVIFQDVTNGNRETMIGPDDSDLLIDTSPTNVCNRENMPRHAVLKVDNPTSGEMASLYGYAHLRDHNTPNRQGTGSTAGAYVKTAAGAWVPSYQMRAGQTVRYANETTVRRIHGKRWSSVDRIADLEFDNLPYTTDSLFERIGIALVGIN